jgi:hypothetical protein
MTARRGPRRPERAGRAAKFGVRPAERRGAPMVTTLDRCPAWMTENLATLGNGVGHLRIQLDGLLEDLEYAPDARVSYLESQLAGFSLELARLDVMLDELRVAIDQEAHPEQASGERQLPLVAVGDA